MNIKTEYVTLSVMWVFTLQINCTRRSFMPSPSETIIHKSGLLVGPSAKEKNRKLNRLGLHFALLSFYKSVYKHFNVYNTL